MPCDQRDTHADVCPIIEEMKRFDPSVVVTTLFRDQWQQPLLLWLVVASFSSAIEALIIALTARKEDAANIIALACISFVSPMYLNQCIVWIILPIISIPSYCHIQWYKNNEPRNQRHKEAVG